MPLNIPNSLTLLRIALIPVFVIAYYLPVSWAHMLATAIFGLAAITDWFDGYLARKWGETSAFGAFLDPVADKLMVATALVLIVEANPTSFEGIWLAVPAAIIVGREITISALREWMAEIGRHGKVAVNWIGKVKTTMQMIALLLLLFQDSLFGLPTATLGFVALYVAAVLTIWSMVVYLSASLPVMFAEDKRRKNQAK